MGSAAITPAPSPHEPPKPAAEQQLATGIFVVGDVGLRPGVRYAISTEDDKVLVRGPIDESPRARALIYRLDRLETAVTGDRLVLGATQGRRRRHAAFNGLIGMTALEVKAEIARRQAVQDRAT